MVEKCCRRYESSNGRNRIMSGKIKVGWLFSLCLALSFTLAAQTAPNCSGLPDYSKLKSAVIAVVKEGENANGGLGNQMWAVVVNRDGIVCAVTFSGPDRGAQWPGSRMIAAE